MHTEHTKNLYLELTSLENRGVTIWLDDTQSDSKSVTDELLVNEDTTYMRDYVFDEGVFKEIHFDKIEKMDEIDKSTK